jgi:CBS-domain-containing membrane protein
MMAMSSADSRRAAARRKKPLWAWGPAAARPWKEPIFAGLGAFITIFALASARAELSSNLLIAPFGASCVLVFAIPQSPLAQPRNVVGGHLISTVAGLMVFNALGQTPLAFGLGVGLAITAMLLTGTVHPPAGADPIVVVFASASWPFLFAPVLVGTMCIILMGAAFHRWVTRKVYPLDAQTALPWPLGWTTMK